ncbi:MAG: hypothetical protein OCC45_12565 [Desulfotalea sp.]
MSSTIVKASICVAALAIGAGVGSQFYVNKEAKKQADAMIAEIGPEAKVTYSEVKGDIIDRGLTIKDLKISPIDDLSTTITIDNLSLTGYDPTSTFQSNMCLKANGITFPLAPIYKEDKTFEDLNFGEKIEGSMSSCYKIDLKGKKFEVKEYSIAAKKVGAIKFSMTLDNLDFGLRENDFKNKSDGELIEQIAKQAENDPMMVFRIAMSIALQKAELNYIDDGLTEAVMKAVAKDKQQEVLQVKSELINLLSISLAGEQKTTVELREILSELIMGQSDSITLTAKPNEAVNLNAMQRAQNFDDAVKILELKVSN